MILHIVKRELLDHLTSLRFACTTLILVALMMTNAIGHLRNHPQRIRKYSENVTESRNALKSRTQLYLLLKKGPGSLYKRPSALAFIADGGETFLPNAIKSGGSWRTKGFGSETLESIWWMGMPYLNDLKINNFLPTATQIDWVFIITYLLSLIPLLFTYDALSGERERGTLRLCLAHPISRHTFFIGKFLGAFIAVLIPLVFAMLCNLTSVSLNTWTQLAGTDWGRLGIIVLIVSCYIATFTAMGLLVSAATKESLLSFVLLLFIWVTVVVFMPSTLGTLTTKWMPPVKTRYQFQRSKEAAVKQIENDFLDQILARKERQIKEGNFFGKLQKLTKMSPEDAAELVRSASEKVDNSELRIMADRVNKDIEIRERLNRERFNSQNDQIQLARTITRLSPAAMVQYSIESMAGTGYSRHLQFLSNVERYVRNFRNFIVETDQSDPESLHIIGVPKGMSKKFVSPRLTPIFEDQITFRDTFNTTTVDMLCLVLFPIIFLFAGSFVFLRIDV